ncbi:uncharacterized protein LOC126609133 [Malus sylvestris]|uniref:uncharacterized protein LOC126609133 n=1 Tax=Malus sylvestris TaxID=3752 RepID=UPI0021ABA312|nr:uncharacterized protein LOC126609133 [Malus sylvestris]
MMPALPKFLLDSSGNHTSTLNPQYVTWFKNDQNIFIWISSTLSDALIPYTIGVNSARELWSKLESCLATASQSHIHKLCSYLRNITKGDSMFWLGSTIIDKLNGLLLSKELKLTTCKKAFSSTRIQTFNSFVGLLPTPIGDFGSHAFFTQSGSNLNSYGSQQRGNFSNLGHYNNRDTQRNYQGF